MRNWTCSSERACCLMMLFRSAPIRWVTRYTSWKSSTDLPGVNTSNRPTTFWGGAEGQSAGFKFHITPHTCTHILMFHVLQVFKFSVGAFGVDHRLKRAHQLL